MADPSPTPTNPYSTMTDDEMKKNFSQMAEVLNQRSLGIDYHEAFKLEKATVSEGDKKKVELADKFLAFGQQMLVEAGVKAEDANPAPVDPNLEKMAQVNLDNAVREIKEIDKDIPIDGIVNSGKSVFDKLETIGHIKSVAQHHGKVVKGLRDTISTSPGVENDKFTGSSSSSGSWADKIASWQKSANVQLGVTE